MSDHFVYQYKAGGGLGLSDPYWPYVSGGLGNAIHLVIITDWESGTVELRWYEGDPALGWAPLIPMSGWAWKVLAPSTVQVGAIDTQPFGGDGESIWSIQVGDWLWTQGAASLGWKAKDSQAGWHITEVQPAWSADNAVSSWMIGEAR